MCLRFFCVMSLRAHGVRSQLFSALERSRPELMRHTRTRIASLMRRHSRAVRTEHCQFKYKILLCDFKRYSCPRMCTLVCLRARTHNTQKVYCIFIVIAALRVCTFFFLLAVSFDSSCVSVVFAHLHAFCACEWENYCAHTLLQSSKKKPSAHTGPTRTTIITRACMLSFSKCMLNECVRDFL